jgi:very-short-patch-repair endonuclease
MATRLAAALKIPKPDGADALVWQLNATGLGGFFEREYRFHVERMWRLDIAFTSRRLGVEVEGFAAGGAPGRHQRAAGFNADAEKYAELAIAGWRLIRVTSKHIKSGIALQWIERALA